MFRFTPGRATVLVIVALGIALAAFNVYYRYATTNRIHRHWGTAAMLRIAETPRAEWWEFAAPADEKSPLDAGQVRDAAEGIVERIVVDGQTLAIRRRGDLIGARGFVHLRNSLGQNASYDWTHAATAGRWRWALVFADDQARTVLLVDDGHRVVRTLESSEPLALTEKMSAGLKTFFAEQAD